MCFSCPYFTTDVLEDGCVAITSSFLHLVLTIVFFGFSVRLIAEREHVQLDDNSCELQ